ncbi:Aspartokinase [[Candida] zeylanoides]
MSLSDSYSSVLDLAAHDGWVVQKFGGTSVGKFPEQIVDDIVKSSRKGSRVAVVCSARSSHTKSEGTTSRLIRAADVAAEHGDFHAVLQLIEDDHVANAARVAAAPIRAELVRATRAEVARAAELLQACRVIGETSARTLDQILSVGEKLSCLFMAALMNDRGVRARYVDLSDVVPAGSEFDDGFYGMLGRELAQRVQQADAAAEAEAAEVAPAAEAANAESVADSSAAAAATAAAAAAGGRRFGIVPVLTGYFGTVPGGLLNRIGRGYTDLCAALCAVGLGADELQIWKEVDGIFTADPRKVPNARLLESVTPEEAAELTYYGSEVIHPFTMEQVIRAKIPIRIKNVINPRGRGTVIYPDNVARRGEATPPHPPVAYEALPPQYIVAHRKRSATAITAKQDIVVVNVHSNKKTLSHGFLAHIFTTLDRHKLVVDLISTSEVHVSMALSVQNEQRRALSAALHELNQMGTVDVTRNMTIVSLVGKQMVNFIGIAGNMFKVLADERINIEMISQGANEINISAVINERDTLRALQSIHARLLEGVYESEPTATTPSASAVDLRLEALKLQ